MAATTKAGVVLTVCAILTQSVNAQQVTEWIDQGNNVWTNQGSWLPSVPDINTEAEHETQSSIITVNVTNAECAKFTGAISGSSRALWVGAGKKLHVGSGGLIGTGTGRFPVRLAHGSSPSNPTILDVDGDVEGVQIYPTTSSPAFVDNATIIVDGDMRNNRCFLGDGSDLNIGGDLLGGGAPYNDQFFFKGSGQAVVIGDCTGVILNIEPSGTDVFTMYLHSGGTTSPLLVPWYMNGNGNLVVFTDYIAQDNVSTYTAVVTLRQTSEMNVWGVTTGAKWIDEDDSVFYSNNSSASKIIGGLWEVRHRSKVLARRIEHGIWDLEDPPTTAVPYRVDVVDFFAPDDLSVSRAKARTNVLGALPASGGGLTKFAWQMTLLDGATMEVADEAWHAGTGDGLSANSKLSYSGYYNKYNAAELYLNGEVCNLGGTVDAYVTEEFVVQAQTVRKAGSSTLITPYELEGFGLGVREAACTQASTLEVFSPDYKSTEDFNPHNVVFSDSPCVKLFSYVSIDDYVSNGCTKLVDDYASTPISGDALPPTDPPKLSEALYVVDGKVTLGAKLTTGAFRVYYTDSFSNPQLVEGHAPIQVTATAFGDFDGDGNGAETADADTFRAAYCTCRLDAAYNPLVDGDCDGDVDTDDVGRYTTNWGAIQLPFTCGDPCAD